MRALNYWMGFVTIIALLFTSCTKEEKIRDEGTGTLSFGALLNDLASNRAEFKQQLNNIPSCSDAVPSFVEVVLNGPTNVGSMEEPLVIRVNSTPTNNGNYFTEESGDLELEAGIYTLEYFAVYDGNPIDLSSNRIWIAPHTGGEMASFVSNPLPLDIDLRAGVKKYVEVDVLCFDDRMVNEYGYTFFDIDRTTALKFCVFGNFCNESGRHFPAHFRVDAWRYSGDPQNPRGSVLVSDLVNTVGTNSNGDAFAEPLCLALPAGNDSNEYYLEITLLDSDAYDTEERLVRSGVITAGNVRGLFDGDSNLDYFHFKVGCESGDSPPLFETDHIVQVPEGYTVERLTYGLHLPTTATWDDEGNMFVVEAGGGLFPNQLAPMKIVQIMEDGTRVEAVNLDNRGIEPAIVGLLWHDGWFYITHRADDLSGAVSRVSKTGQLELLFKGIIDSKAEHQINDIQVGPDGYMYVAVGLAANAAVVGPDLTPYVKKSPDLRSTPCQDIVLLGKNFETPNFLTEEEGDMIRTGAYVPFGEETSPGQVIAGVSLCGGSILRFDPNNAMSTISTYAWGFRNIIGLSWDSNGNMYAGENGYDIRGSRPVNDYMDASLRIHQGMWYGVPDFSANREPLNDPRFEVPDEFQAPVYINDELIGKQLGFLIDHAASALTPPNSSVVLGSHEFNSSPSMLDAAPASWGEWEDHLFIAEWGDLAPPTNPLRGEAPAGFQVVRVNPGNGQLEPFATNPGNRPASYLGMQGKGLERPFDVKFGPDGALYIIDYGEVTIDMSQVPPYVYNPNSGAIWKITKTE